MKRDIRTLFDSEEEEQGFELPPSHSKAFLKKLKQQSKTQSRSNVRFLLPLAIIAVVIFGYMGLTKVNKTKPDLAPIVAQVKSVESQYLKEITNEWQNFLLVTNDSTLITRYKKRLQILDRDYQNLSLKFKTNPDDLITIEALVSNLQTRLDILKNIQKHIKILNKNTNENEQSL